jgi:4-hydroxybenzoate polyprenyltransferase
MDPVDQYPTLMRLLRLRSVLPAAAALLVAAGGAIITVETARPHWVIAGLILAFVVFFSARAALELLDLVTDLLVPR